MLEPRSSPIQFVTSGTRTAKPTGGDATAKRPAASGPSWRAWLWAGTIHLTAVAVVLSAGYAAQAMRSPEPVVHRHENVVLRPSQWWTHGSPRPQPARCRGCGRTSAATEAARLLPRPLDSDTRASDAISLPKRPAPPPLGGEEFHWPTEGGDESTRCE